MSLRVSCAFWETPQTLRPGVPPMHNIFFSLGLFPETISNKDTGLKFGLLLIAIFLIPIPETSGGLILELIILAQLMGG
ncbi:hypothetical protein AYI69_g29 [Smittium culicis]|uniref:Uncharacterized protein n=1 Tax=Smittium culicis TaxID=133412 RepID=A0A1R1YU63_9FUNG|nr:hypothetical protein AYI69_g29 [Smittium culicis]